MEHERGVVQHEKRRETAVVDKGWQRMDQTKQHLRLVARQQVIEGDQELDLQFELGTGRGYHQGIYVGHG